MKARNKGQVIIYLFTKQLLAVVVFLYLSVGAIFGQEFVLSGKGFGAEKTVSLNFYYATSPFPEIPITTEKDGTFKKVLSIPYSVFAFITCDGKSVRLLLSPGKHLQVIKNEDSIVFSGRGAAENRMLRNDIFKEALFFAGHGADWKQNRYAYASKDTIERQVFRRAKREVDSGVAIITANSKLSPTAKGILISELRYYYQLQLYEFCDNILRWAKNKNRDYFLARALNWLPVPDGQQVRACRPASFMLANHCRNAIAKASEVLRTDSIKGRRIIADLFGMTFDDITNKAQNLGDSYIIWKYSRSHFNLPQQEKILVDMISFSNRLDDVHVTKALFDTLQRLYPRSCYVPTVKAMITNIEGRLSVGAANTNIHIYDTEKLTSLAALTGKHKNKIIYLDLWGTWCGPCINIMKHVPMVKKLFAGKDVVFAYLAMDEDDQESRWKNFIQVNTIEGEHYRLTNGQIQQIWKELGKDTEQQYPTYVLFDKTGKLVNTNAARPDEPGVLKQQIEQILND
ncbi:TlpA family protein disulfide reductase [Niabella drilacis]|uniref:Redoxin n=1 Tax=Niabella drilacis (strain DSM 25811 / CCM 8410 / CCUG 62505 / LMG 26954 / E90) TaxID=1285928 RepID=A0A1G6XUD6_NIADE|nr:TlpA disulfide reductase family protein [Niabella drilacis]SDD81750.1 Redoxin [Niabella drilacis]